MWLLAPAITDKIPFHKLTSGGEQRNKDNSQLINENKKLENIIDKLKQRKFIAVEKFRVLSYYIYIYDWGLNKNQRIGCF